MNNSTTNKTTGLQERAFIIAWIFGLVFYFLEYVIRSSPAVMIPELISHFKVNALGVSTVLGTYYYTYSITSLVAGVALDRAGARAPVTAGVGILAAGCIFFAVSNIAMGDAGRLLQGAGSAFAFTGCVYLASHGFPPKYIATAIGLTQCVGMLGGSAGQFVVGPLIQNGMSIDTFWMGIGIACGVTGVLVYFTTPREDKATGSKFSFSGITAPYKVVFTNGQSYLSGLLSGLLFAPTTIFAMTWGVAFFEQDRNVPYHSAVIICSMVPLGWVLGCPLLGWISDIVGRRKPVLSVGILIMVISFAQLVYMPDAVSPILSMFIFGVASGTAMIPYTIIKEANPDEVKGSATGAINFLTFGVTAFLGPVFAARYGKSLSAVSDHESHFRQAGIFILMIAVVALIVSFIIGETGRNKSVRVKPAGN